jgi:hypothetical protein
MNRILTRPATTLSHRMGEGLGVRLYRDKYPVINDQYPVVRLVTGHCSLELMIWPPCTGNYTTTSLLTSSCPAPASSSA